MRSTPARGAGVGSAVHAPRLAVLNVAEHRWVAAIALDEGDWADLEGEYRSDADAARAAMSAIRARVQRAGRAPR